MKKLFLACTMLLCSLGMNAASLETKALKLEKSNALASRFTRKDTKNDNCAVILLDVVGVYNLKFKEAVGDVAYSLNEYVIYVPKETTKLTYDNGTEKGSFDLEQFGIDINSLATYRLTIESSDHMRSAVFYVNPANAKLTFDNVDCTLDANGAVAIDKAIGKYQYTVSAPGYKPASGEVELVDESILTSVNVELEQITYPVVFNCNVPDAALFIDNVPYGTVESAKEGLQLPEGNHSYRIVKENYREENGTIEIDGNKESYTENIDLKQFKTKTVIHSEERTRTSVTMRSCGDYHFATHLFLDDDAKSGVSTINIGFNQYAGGIFTLREGLGVGVGFSSYEWSQKMDKYHELLEKKEYDAPLYVTIPLQAGVTIPLSKYFTSFVSFLGGVYGSYYHAGHHTENFSRNKAQEKFPDDYKNIMSENVKEYDEFDYGFKVSVLFYFNKFNLGFEGMQSMGKYKLGYSVGMTLGYKFVY